MNNVSKLTFIAEMSVSLNLRCKVERYLWENKSSAIPGKNENPQINSTYKTLGYITSKKTVHSFTTCIQEEWYASKQSLCVMGE
jgi:hypothetical protein